MRHLKPHPYANDRSIFAEVSKIPPQNTPFDMVVFDSTPQKKPRLFVVSDQFGEVANFTTRKFAEVCRDLLSCLDSHNYQVESLPN